MPNNPFQSFLNSFINFESKLHQTSAQEFSLDDIKRLLQRLDHPEKTLKVIHVAGTKGKGSTSVMIASLLKEAGYSVGLYTSPHLYDLNERIRILKPGQTAVSSHKDQLFVDSISEEDLNVAIRDTRGVIEDVHQSSSRGLTFFEVVTAIALHHFAKQNVDWVVLETGLGGRLDATNAVDSIAAVVTPISLDHQNILGDTIAKIAAEKAGIIKSKFQKVIIAPQVPEAAEVLQRRCQELGITPVWVEKNVLVKVSGREPGRQILDFKTPPCEYNNIKLSLAGAHQRLNAATAVCAAEVLQISFAAGRLNAAFSTLQWPGRFEIIGRHPTVIVDCAHNEESIRVLLDSLAENFPGQKPCFILGVSQDKNMDAMFRLLQNHAKCVILTRADHPRARLFSKEDAKRYFSGITTAVTDSAADAVQAMKMLASSDDIIVAAGSVFLAAEVRQYYV